MRSAFGLRGQKCSALSRVYVEDAVADTLIELLRKKIAAIKIGDPPLRENWLGPVTTPPRTKFASYCDRLRSDGGAHPRRRQAR